MMLIVLDKDPIVAAKKVPESIRHKQLLELMQMLSCVVDFGFKQIPQGKEIKEWITKNKVWISRYAETLFSLFYVTAKNAKKQTVIKYKCLLDLLWYECMGKECEQPTTAILRYVKGYECKYPTNTELPIDIAIEIYTDYVHNFKRWE